MALPDHIHVVRCRGSPRGVAGDVRGEGGLVPRVGDRVVRLHHRPHGVLLHARLVVGDGDLGEVVDPTVDRFNKNFIQN